jgi:hypothetical protein
MNKNEKIAGLFFGLLATTSLATLAMSIRINPTIHKGTYQGFEVQAFYEGQAFFQDPMRRVIIGYEGNSPISRIIGTDDPEVEGVPDLGFESIETLFLPPDDPLAKLATTEHLENAWSAVYQQGDKTR